MGRIFLGCHIHSHKNERAMEEKLQISRRREREKFEEVEMQKRLAEKELKGGDPLRGG